MASDSRSQAELGRSRPLEEGAHFASYVILGLLGSGGHARVYRARHQTLGHEVALKLFEPAAAPGPSGVARFLREAHLAASVRHPHVVHTQDAGVQDGVPFLVMELLEGRDLEAHLRAEGALEELALIELAIPIVAALMALHAQGLVHGDLGPGNIFLARAAQRPGVVRLVQPKLLDVGVSKPHRQLRLTAAARQQLMGSPLYMAPEAMLGHELTPASDQYSLGLILYEAVTGVNPFMATSLKESVRLIIAGQRLAVLEQSVPPSPGLADIIERALSVAPEDRFPDLASLGRALLRLADQRTRAEWEFSFQSGPAAAGVTAAPWPATSAAPRSSRWGALGVSLAVLGWATAGVVWFSASRWDPAQAYVLLGPSASPLPRRSEPAVTTTTLALAPCPEARTGDVAPGSAVAGDASDGELSPGSAHGPDSVASGGEGGLPQFPPALEGAGGAAAALEGAGLGPPAAGESVDAADLALPGDVPPITSAASAGGAGPRLPTRGTNNAPIFD